MDYIVNILADIIPGDSPYKKSVFYTYRVHAESVDKAADRAIKEVANGNRAIDTMMIKHTQVIELELMPILYA